LDRPDHGEFHVHQLGPGPVVAVDPEMYVVAYPTLTDANTIAGVVEVHALSDDRLLWSTSAPGPIWSVSVGGSRVVVSYSSGSGDDPTIARPGLDRHS
jgi:hypothetical protein